MKILSAILSLLTILMLSIPLSSQINIEDVSLDYYLEKQEYDPTIPSPAEFLGYEVGTWQVNHDRLLAYMYKLAELSDRVTITEYAQSYETRKLVHLTISSPSNLSNIKEIKAKHKSVCDPTIESEVDPNSLPLILYQGYSIHGDESSGGHAAIIMAYYLAAGQSPRVKDILDNMIVLLDPCFNPDGFQRYANWINSQRGATINPDPIEREHNEPWPTGRTNHYWFDLNRDWLLLTHPESRGRIKVFQEWNPHVLTDHHEMGTNNTFFFQPGVPSRTNPLTPEINQRLTEDIGKYHMKNLDSIGVEYFSKKQYDDFYYGKGSTYPDGQGCIGILFEQATSEGFLQESDNGLLSFPFCIRNQVVTSLSTQEACLRMKDEIIRYQIDFFKGRYEESLEDPVKGYLVHVPDPWKRDQFYNILQHHNIEAFSSNNSMYPENFPPQESLLIPVDQKQYTLIKSIFETQTAFTDSIFYDVSTWVFPYAFNTEYQKIGEISGTLKDYEYSEVLIDFLDVENIVIPWDNYMAPKAVYQLQLAGISVSRLTKSIEEDNERLNAGSVLVNINNLEENQRIRLEEILRENKIKNKITNVKPKKIKEHLIELNKPSIALLTGDGVNAYEIGDAYFQLDYRWNIPVTKLEVDLLNEANLSRYSCIVMAHGKYNFNDESKEKLEDWISKGGNLIVMRGAIESLENMGMVALEKEDETSNQGGGQVIGGTMFWIDIQKENPLFWGYAQDKIPVFKKGTQWYKLTNEESMETIGEYSKFPLISGYASKENLYKAPYSAAVITKEVGEGSMLLLVDNPNFRGFWYGGSQLFSNCIYFQKN